MKFKFDGYCARALALDECDDRFAETLMDGLEHYTAQMPVNFPRMDAPLVLVAARMLVKWLEKECGEPGLALADKIQTGMKVSLSSVEDEDGTDE